MHVCMYSSDAMYCNCTDSNLRGPRSWWVSVSKKSSGAQRSTHVAPEKLDTLVLAVALTCFWLEIFFPSLPPIRPSQSRAQTRWVGGSVEEKTAMASAVAGGGRKIFKFIRTTKNKTLLQPLAGVVCEEVVSARTLHTYMHTYIHTSQSCALINEKQFNKSIRL
jgi:hypothetical protein